MTVEILRYAAFTDDPPAATRRASCSTRPRFDDATMLGVAAEVGYSETAFLIPGGGGRFAVRYFSPLAEVDFCGHATIALAVAYAERTGRARSTFDTAAGRIEVRRRRTADGTGWPR